MKTALSIWQKILEFVANAVFPQSLADRRAAEIVSNIAKLRQDIGDKSITYPCPAYSFFNYRLSGVRAMIWRLKYRGDKSVAKLFAEKMYDQLVEELTELAEWSNFREPILVPIPMSKSKLRTRGFNQTEAICGALSHIDQGRFFSYKPNVLYKIKDTTSQARVKDRTERLKNLKDSFLVKDKSLLKNQNIILLDDVLTTGSTLSEATLTLKNAGVRNIIWVVVAH